MSVKSKIINLYEENPRELIFRLLSYLLSSLILPNIIILLFVVYMSHSNFFSYDFFIDGLFGMKLFFTVTLFFIFFLSLAMAGGLIVIIGHYKNSKRFLFNDWWFIYLINTIFLILFLWLPFDNFFKNEIPLTWAIYLILISIALCTHIAMLLFYDAKNQFFSLLIFIISISLITIYFSKETSKLMSIGLREFGIGGDINTEITINGKDKVEKGKLILVAPKFIFFKPYKQHGIKTYPISVIESFYVGNDINLSK